MSRLAWITLAALLTVGPAHAQTPPPAPTRAMTRAEVLAQLETAAATSPQMMVARMVNTEAYRVNVVKRTAPQGAIAHDVGTEVHYIIEGTATLVTGGTIVRPATGGATAMATIRDGASREVHPGDIVLVPVGTPHWYRAIAQPLTYLEVRFDVKEP
jgi:mannose-6-phosphate isomerase-like protein (cupin superfamily)